MIRRTLPLLAVGVFESVSLWAAWCYAHDPVYEVYVFFVVFGVSATWLQWPNASWLELGEATKIAHEWTTEISAPSATRIAAVLSSADGSGTNVTVETSIIPHDAAVMRLGGAKLRKEETIELCREIHETWIQKAMSYALFTFFFMFIIPKQHVSKESWPDALLHAWGVFMLFAAVIIWDLAQCRLQSTRNVRYPRPETDSEAIQPVPNRVVRSMPPGAETA